MKTSLGVKSVNTKFFINILLAPVLFVFLVVVTITIGVPILFTEMYKGAFAKDMWVWKI